jgi:hypothetical protein
MGVFRNANVIEKDLTATRHMQSCNTTGYSGLPAPRLAHKRNDLPMRNREGHILDSNDGPTSRLVLSSQ